MHLKEFMVEYYTKSGRRAGTRISAWTALDAKLIIEKYPDYCSIALYPKEIK